MSKSSKSHNALSIKNFSDSAKEYGSFEDLKIKKSARTNSVSRRENSPLLRDFKKNVSKIKKKVPNFSLLGFVDINRPQKKLEKLEKIEGKDIIKQRIGSARPASPYVRKETKEISAKSFKPSWKF